MDKFYRITNVRESLCRTMLVADSLEESVLCEQGGPMPDLELFVPGARMIPRGYRPVEGEYFKGHQVYERIP